MKKYIAAGVLALLIGVLLTSTAFAKTSFADVPDGYWAEEAIEWANEEGYMLGKSKTAFAPGGTVNSQQAWMTLARVAGEKPANMAQAKAWAQSKGMVDTENVTMPATRLQLVKYLWYAAGRPASYTAILFDFAKTDKADVVGDLNKVAMSWALYNGILTGTEDGRMDPNGTATRAQFAAILQRYVEWTKKEGPQITGYASVDHEITLAEVKSRYGSIDKIATGSASAQAVFRNGMDAYAVNIPYAGGKAEFSLAEKFSANAGEYEKIYVTFTAAIGAEDTDISKALDSVKLLTSADGVNYVDSGVAFTVKDTGETVEPAKNSKGIMPMYEFTSGDIAPKSGSLKNIKIAVGDDAEGILRLMTVFVWADTGEDIKVPEFGGNLNPVAEKTAEGSKTAYNIYDTKFENLYSWAVNVITQKYGTVNYGGKETSFVELPLSPQAVVDGTSPKLYSPNMKLDTGLYDEVIVEYTYFRNADDPAFDMQLAYSVDNGWNWIDLPVQPTITAVANGVEGAAETWKAKVDLKASIPDTEITNVVIKPYADHPIYTGKTSAKVWDDTYTSGSIKLLDFSITGKSSSANVEAVSAPVYIDRYDALAIQTMIDEAVAAGKHEVTIPSVNPRTGESRWIISDTIEVPSEMTVYVTDCYMVAGDFFIGNIITNKACWIPEMTPADEEHDIHIIGVGEANFAGGRFNGLHTNTVNNSGFNSLYNPLIMLNNVRDFSIENLRIEESRIWGMMVCYSQYGVIRHIDVWDSRFVVEQDGIDVRCGTNNILVEDVAGRSGDDTVALNAIRPYQLRVYGKHDDIREITVRNVNSRLVDMRMQVRITAANGYKIHNCTVENVRDTRPDFGGLWASSSIRVGDDKYWSDKDTEVGDITGIVIRNVEADSQYAVQICDLDIDWGRDVVCENLKNNSLGAIINGNVGDLISRISNRARY